MIVTVIRWRRHPFTVSSLSSQLLENKQHFWGMVPVHYGILVVLTGHVVAFAIPRAILAWNGSFLGAMSLDLMAQSFPQSQVGLGPVARLLGEVDPGVRTRVVISAWEGLMFGSGLVLGLTYRPKRG